LESRKNPQVKLEPSIPEAADRTNLLIRELHSRLSRGGGELNAENPGAGMDDLDKQLQEAFERQAGKATQHVPATSELRTRVIDAVVDRILQDWGWQEGGGANPLEEEVIERLVGRVSQRLRSAGAANPEPKKG